MPSHNTYHDNKFKKYSKSKPDQRIDKGGSNVIQEEDED
jgi:hypothetical protein